MQFASAGLGSIGLGSILNDPGASNDEALSPIVTLLSGEDIRHAILMDTLRIEDTLGQPVTAAFTLKDLQPQEGQPVTVRYFSQVIFSGIIDHVTKRSPDLRTMFYECECLDWSHILLRRKIRRNFTDVTVQSVVQSLLDNELAGEGLTLGRIDSRSSVPLIDARDAKAFEVLRTLAGATGQTVFVDFDKSIQMRGATFAVQETPEFILDEVGEPILDESGEFILEEQQGTALGEQETVQALTQPTVLLSGTSLIRDLETYRNRQIVVVTGTPAQGQDALTVSIQRENADQIAARSAIEGGTGLYEEIEAITHPTSNDGGQLALLGIGYANLRLATSGTPRLTFRCRMRGYGFRAGQFADVDLPTFGISGTFVIQKVSLSELSGAYLFHQLELTSSNLQQRAYEAWLGMVAGGKVTVQMPSAVTNNLETFDTPGAHTWISPITGTAEFTSYGGSGGGGGGAVAGLSPPTLLPGGHGGNSGKAITILTDLIEGEVFDMFIGSEGIGGAPATRGTSGTASWVKRGVSTVAQGNGGGFGGKGNAPDNGFTGSPGSGVGDAVSVGGGRTGGDGAPPTNPASSGSNGQGGLVEVRW